MNLAQKHCYILDTKRSLSLTNAIEFCALYICADNVVGGVASMEEFGLPFLNFVFNQHSIYRNQCGGQVAGGDEV